MSEPRKHVPLQHYIEAFLMGSAAHDIQKEDRKVAMIGLVLLILVAGLLGYLCYLIALRISHDATIASIVGIIVFVLLLFGGWGRVGGLTF